MINIKRLIERKDVPDDVKMDVIAMLDIQEAMSKQLTDLSQVRSIPTDIALKLIFISDELSNDPILNGAKMSLQALNSLWDELGDIPVNDHDQIESAFLHFEAGTDKLVIWRWFEEQNPRFSVGDRGLF